MARALLLVLDSVGIGGAEDAAALATRAPTRSATSPRRAPRDAATGRACARARSGSPISIGSGWRWQRRPPPGKALPGLEAAPAPPAVYGFGVEILEGQGHAVRPLGDRRRAGPLRLGLFPARRCPTFPAALTDALIREARLPGILGNKHASGTAIIAELGEEHIRTRQADLLHLGRLGLPDRRARDPFRPRPALRGLRDRAKAGRPAQYRPGDRAALRRRDEGAISSAPPTAATTRCRRPSRRSSTARSRPGGR